jgi:hypothetical protein
MDVRTILNIWGYSIFLQVLGAMIWFAIHQLRHFKKKKKRKHRAAPVSSF